ncbi:aldehyde ferredoxin oxidoreductase N-terminal domain-containing protein [Desulfonatronovibrio hydrogenovorans]|uniref:aldehyde ferredoxin oxidoreductase N-terminal domain-containing protein n=1 Tax=Desulfonatronovibrio hydrogenovorans TaxID=53245 RepID=UPI00068BB386|nr:aldehyde ferredoxin oxidoreductase N-terminal domain-containing protein [Desulfonatronovibrio hydrogenovorans]
MNSMFKVLVVDLSRKKSKVEYFDTRKTWIGGSGLAAGLFEHFADFDADPFHPDQPLILAIGPLTGLFPLMSKTIMSFMSPYNGQYAESHGGGRSALALRFAGYDALVVTGRARKLTCLGFGSQEINIQDVHYLKGMDIFRTGKVLRGLKPRNPGHRSILRIGPAGENRISYACVNVDTYRHFGRMGGGAVMGAKNLKGIIISGDSTQDLPHGRIKEYNKVYREIYSTVTESGAVRKYHNLGTPENLIPLNELRALPWRNLQSTHDPEIESISGEKFADDLLLRQVACAGCPVGCIHIGLLRERFGHEHEYLYRQVSYDYEPIFGMGSMLGITSAPGVLTLLEEVEKLGLDAISAGVALAWATEALEKGVVGIDQTIVDLQFGNVQAYVQALTHLAGQDNEFYLELGKGALVAAEKYGGEDFACVLGQEMAGYATGENYFVSQALGFRHSHLDTGAYSFDQEEQARDIHKSIDYMQSQEIYRILMCSVAGCLFGRKAYPKETILKALNSTGLDYSEQELDQAVQAIQAHRWAIKFRTGFNPDEIKIPGRFLEVETWKGRTDPDYLFKLKEKYQEVLRTLAEKHVFTTNGDQE